MQRNLYKIYFWKVFHMYYKLICILYALICGQNFILVKSGCYTLLCLMGSSHRSCTHTIPWFSHRSFTEHPSGSAIAAFPQSRLVHLD
jgi:hypothetical protein